MEEIWYSGRQWRWNTNFGSYVQTRIFEKGSTYDESATPMPLRVHMVRGTIFWPIIMGPAAALRISAGTWRGAPVMCVLGSRGLGDDAGYQGRRWEETEFCLDAKTGLLHTYSIAPGIYAVYDYADAIHFHASTLPRTISIYEGSTAVLKIRLDSLTDAGPLDPKLFTPSPQMLQRNGMFMSGTFRYPMAGGVSPVPTNGAIQPLIVHASVTNGKVEEIEALQNSDPALSAAAVALVKNASHEQESGGFQREVFVNVRFMPRPTAQPGQ